MPALYMPIILMLLDLMFRGGAFEYRWRTECWTPLWDRALFGGSLTAALGQGISPGAFVQGIEIENRAYAGGWWDWLRPLSILCGVAVQIGHDMLGATWLNMKLEGHIQRHMRSLAWPAAIGTVICMGFVSLWTPFLDAVYFSLWFVWPTAAFSVSVPLLVLGAIVDPFYSLRRRYDVRPYPCAQALFVLGFIGIRFYPNIIPPLLTIMDAAAPDESLRFALVGKVVLVPMILIYTSSAYLASVLWASSHLRSERRSCREPYRGLTGLEV